MGTRANGIFGSLPILAAAFGRREGINVVIGGDKAQTDGKTIFLPTLPLDCDEELAVKAFGFLYHEAGHIEFTDFAQVQEAHLQDGPFVAKLLNVIEDVRMEDMRNASYAGSAHSLRLMVAAMVKDGWLGTPEGIASAPPQDVINLACLTYLRSTYLEQPCEAVAAVWMERAEQLLGTAGMVKFKALMNQMNALDTTADALALARRIKTLVEETAQEPPPPADESGESQEQSDDNGGADDAGNDADSDGGSDGDAGDNGEAGQDSAGGNGAQDGDGTEAGSASTPAGTDVAQQPARKALEQALAAGMDDFAPTDLGDILGKSLEQDAAEAVVADERAHPGAGSVDRPLTVRKTAVGGQGELQQVLASSQQLRTKLAAAMDAEARVKVTHRRQGNRLDGNVAHRLFTGDTRVFLRRENTRKVNTAVQILLDRSGSMANGKVEVARKAALASAVGIAQIHGCKVAAAAFPDVEVLKDFDETARGSAGRFGIYATGGTPMGRAMIWAAAQLAARRENRKMLIVITDGDPDDRNMVSRLIAKYRVAGVEVIGVGIQTTSVKGLFPSSVVIQTVDELATALFNVVNAKLRRVA